MVNYNDLEGDLEGQTRGWILTLKAEMWSKEQVEKKLAPWPFVGQLERGEDSTEKNPDGYLHWQIYVESPKAPIRFETLKNLFPKGGKFFRRRGTKKQAHAYCSKKDTFQGIRIAGKKMELEDNRGKRRDLEELKAMADSEMSYSDILRKEIRAARYIKWLSEYCREIDTAKAKTELREVEARYIWGDTGVGKTRGIWEKHASEMFRVTDYRNAFDAYRGENVLVLDEFHGHLDFNLMLNILDRYPLELPARYANQWARFTKVYVVSNVPLWKLYPEVQVEKPAAWAALLRRFVSIEEMKAPVSPEIQDFIDTMAADGVHPMP